MSTILSAQVQQEANELSNLLNGAKFEHLKTGGNYVFTELVIDEETLSFSVLYESLVRESCLWVRPAQRFFDGRFKPQVTYSARVQELLKKLAPYFESDL